MADRGVPTYDLAVVKQLIEKGAYWITNAAFEGAMALSFDRSDIVQCILGLDVDSDFFKTMPAEKAQGLMQDVYKPVYNSTALYVKVQLSRRGTAVIIQFKAE